jgi:hypothetical protein
MKAKFTLASAVFALAALFSFSASAQSDSRIDNHVVTVVIPSVALLDLETSTSKNFTATFTQSNEAGDKLTAPVNNTSLWLNYSSIQTGTTTKRVEIEASTVIDGVDITVTAGSGSGFGKLGTSSGPTKISQTKATLIDGIGSAYTVTGANNGHQLTYNFATPDSDYEHLRSTVGTNVTVTYTLTDN